MRATQYLTLYAQALLVLSFYFDVLAPVALGIGLTVVFLYYPSVLYDATLLSHEDPELVVKMTKMSPPLDRHIIPWIGLHVQHLYFPLFYVIYPLNPGQFDITTKILTVLLFFVYIVWNLLCWIVLGAPAYPIQELLAEKGLFLPATGAVIILHYALLSLVYDYYT